MEKRHSDLLSNMVEEIAHRGVIRLSQRQLRHIHGAERLGRNTWRDISERLPSPLSAKDVLIFKEDDDIYLVRKDKLENLTDWI